MTGLRVGDIEVRPLSDGAFVVRPRYFGDDVPDDARPDVFDRAGAAWDGFVAGPGEMAITLPTQMEEAGWHSMGDVDAALAERSRRRLWAMLAEEGTGGVGAHFPELRAGVVTDGRWRPR